MSHSIDSSSSAHYDITISHHATPAAATPNGTPPPASSSLLYPPRPASPLRHATLTFAFQSVDFTDARYQLPVLMYDQPYYAQLAERPGCATASSDMDGELVGNRLLVERLDYRNVLSVYINSYRIHATPLAKARKDALTASPSPPHQQSHTDEPSTVPVIVKPVPLPAYLLSVASSAFLLLCSSPKSSRAFLLLSNDASAVLRFFGLVSDIIATPRSDQWLDVPDAARMQTQLRAWEEDKEAEMMREEDDRKLKLAAKATNGHEVTSSTIFQPVATYLSATSSTRPTRSALLTSSTRSSHLGGIKNLGNSCFSESDTRVLTDSGFLFLADIEARIDAGQRVLYACYDTSTQSIAYKPGRLVFAAPPTRWVDFTRADTRPLWDETSDDYGSTVLASSASHLTLRTTPEHNMYVQLCTQAGQDGHESYQPRVAGSTHIPPHKQPARELAPGYQCDCVEAGRPCTHGYSHYRLYTGAASGLQTPADVISLTDRDSNSPVAAFGLHSKDELDAFLELFGCWLGNGSMLYDTRADLTSANAVCFASNKDCDHLHLLSLLARLHLVRGQHFTSCESDLRFDVRITEPRWFSFFDDEFGVKHSSSRHYDRRLALLKQGMHSTQRRPSTASSVSTSAAVSVTVASETRTRSLSASISVELVADNSGGDDDEDMPFEDEDDSAAPVHWLPDWVLFRLDAGQLRLVIEGLRQAGRSAAMAAQGQPAAAGANAMQVEHQISTSSVGLRDQLIQACVHAGYSAYFTLNTAASEAPGYNAMPTNNRIYGQEEMEAALRVDSTHRFKPVRDNYDNWSVCYSEVISELLPAQDVRFDGSACRVRQNEEQRSGQAIQQQQATAIATQPADSYDKERDGRVWCVDVQHDDHLIFVQRAHRNASGVVTKVGRTMIISNCYMSAILQALLAQPTFTSALTSPRLVSADHELPSPLPSSSFYWHLVSLALLYQQSDHGVLDIGELKEVMGGKRERFAGNTQQDAHEFLSECLNALQDDVVKCVRASERPEAKADSMVRSESGDSVDSGSDDSSSGGRSSRSPSPLPLPLIRSPSASSFISSALPRHMQRIIHRLSPIHRSFHCEIEYTLTCTNPSCGYTRKNKESCYDLSLDLPDLPAASNHRLASPIPAATASPLLSSQYATSSPSPEHSPTLSPALSPRASPSLPPLSLSAHDASPDLITLDPLRSASPSIDAAAVSSSPPVPARRRQKASAPPSSSLSSLLSTFFSARTLTCNCAHCPSTTVTISAAMRQMPAVLILHVKRFLPNLSKGSYDKRSDRVKVETELNVSFACKPDTKRPGVDEEKDDRRRMDDSELQPAAQQTSDMSTDRNSELSLSVAGLSKKQASIDENGDGHSSSHSPKANGVHASVPVRASKRGMSDEIDLTRSDESDNSPIAATKKHRKNNQQSTSPLVPPTPTSPLAATRRRHAPTSSDTRVTRAMHRKLASASTSATASPSITAASPSPPPAVAPLPLPPPPPPPLPAPPVYQLSSIVHHRGAFAYSGHYLTDIVRAGSGAWTRYDDQFVKEVTSEHSLRQAESEGYIFFYVYGNAQMG